MIQFFSTADNVTAIATASFVLSRAFWVVYRRTLGSARVTVRSLRSLSPGNPVEYVDDLFGRNVFGHQYVMTQLCYPVDKEVKIERRLYNADHGWLTAHFHEGKLIGFAFMLTNSRLRLELAPTCRQMLRGKLGRSTYKQISAELPDVVTSFMAAYNFGYVERHAFARFGNHHYYMLSSTMFGYSSKSRGVPTLSDGMTTPVVDLPRSESAELQYYRSLAAPDTVAVLQSDYTWIDSPSESGAYDREDLKDVEAYGPRGWTSNSANESRLSRAMSLWR